MRLNEAPTNPWVAIKANGLVSTAHCTCMARLGESCSHVGALLFTVEAAINLRKARTCTELLCLWREPSLGSIKKVQATKGSNFFSSSFKESVHILPESGGSTQPEKAAAPHLSEEQKELFKKLAETQPSSAVLALLEGHADKSVLKTLELNIPPPLASYYMTEMLKCTSLQILSVHCDKVFKEVKLTSEQVRIIFIFHFLCHLGMTSKLMAGSLQLLPGYILNNGKRFNQTEPPVNRRLSFEVIPYVFEIIQQSAVLYSKKVAWRVHGDFC